MYRTAGFFGFNVAFSPFEENYVACAAAQYYGLVGNGHLFVLSHAPQGLVLKSSFGTQDAMLSCAFSEMNREHIVTGCGDGVVRLWDLNVMGRPVQWYQEHQLEVSSLAWGQANKSLFASASWDNTIKVWSPERKNALITFAEHKGSANCVVWAPSSPALLCSCGGDGLVKLWDLNSPRSVGTIPAHQSEILSVDWNKYVSHSVATSAVDGSVRVWDLRNPQMPLGLLQGHTHAVRAVKWAPYSKDILASASYDTSVRVWDMSLPLVNNCIEHIRVQSEFVYSVDWSVTVKHMLAFTCWDETVRVLIPQSLLGK